MTAKNFGGEAEIDAQVARGHVWPCLRQFCVFLENRVGRLYDLLRQLESHDNRVVALTIVDSVDFAMCRLMFSQTDRARERLELSGYLFTEHDVVGVVLPDDDKPMAEVCQRLLRLEINIHHTTPLLYRYEGRAAMALYVDNVDTAAQVLREAGLRLVTEDDLATDIDL